MKKENTGLDTETYLGYVRLIADDEGSYKEVESLLEILQFLTRNRYRGKFNWFYNIKYDFESIIKYLDEDDLYNLYYDKRIVYEHFTINYLDKKFMGITDTNNHHYYFYDLFAFLETSLNTASKKYLNDYKLDIINASELNINWDYWVSNRENIIKYCIYDANLTKRLADYFWDLMYKNLNFYPKRPFSKGKLSEEYFLHTCYIPTIENIPSAVLELAYKSYSGGRFEILKRGYSENVFVYDISSAYPYEMTTLLDYSLGQWSKTGNNEFNEYADYGIYYCDVVSMEQEFSPFQIVKSGMNIYPNGRFQQYLDSDDIRFIKENFENCEIRCRHGFEWTMQEEKYPLKEKILQLYKWKQTEKNEEIKYAVKIILNSLYGKTIQVVAGRTGKLFNPVWARRITAGTRRKLLKKGLEKPHAVIAFSTDSVASQEPLRFSEKPDIGDFSFEFKGSGVYVMSDVYTLWNEEKRKNRFRGFKLYKDTISSIFDCLKIKDFDNRDLSLYEMLESMGGTKTKYPIFTNSPYHLGECLIHKNKKNPSMINIFHKEKKDVDINGDIRRYWKRNFKNGLDALENLIESKPLMF